ncbi:MAG: hypothetical protein LBQ12_03365 [Deltaproteobacteria bacterium]|nr:hypothetical protein [Deltaproteobacteria bacterium]
MPGHGAIPPWSFRPTHGTVSWPRVPSFSAWKTTPSVGVADEASRLRAGLGATWAAFAPVSDKSKGTAPGTFFAPHETSNEMLVRAGSLTLRAGSLTLESPKAGLPQTELAGGRSTWGEWIMMASGFLDVIDLHRLAPATRRRALGTRHPETAAPLARTGYVLLTDGDTAGLAPSGPSPLMPSKAGQGGPLRHV